MQSSTDLLLKLGEWSDVFAKEGAGEALTMAERSRMSLWRLATFRNFEDAYDQHRAGALSDAIFEARVRNIERMLSEAPTQVWWRESPINIREYFSDEFAAWIDGMLKAALDQSSNSR